MIGKLKGVIEEIEEENDVIEVNGVGYVEFCQERKMGNIGGEGEEEIMLIEKYVSEDMIRIYGFEKKIEREWLRMLKNVKGVGEKVDLEVIGKMQK